MQLLTYYAQQFLPTKVSSGSPLDRLDTMLTAAGPLAQTWLPGTALGFATMALGAAAHRRGAPDDALRWIGAMLGVLAAAAPMVLPMLLDSRVPGAL